MTKEEAIRFAIGISAKVHADLRKDLVFYNMVQYDPAIEAIIEKLALD